MSRSERLKVGVLVSGNGTNLQAILDASDHPSYPAEVVRVISNRPEAYALQRAVQKNVPAEVIDHNAHPSREAFEKNLLSSLQKSGVQLVVLAGFMRLLSPTFLRAYPHRILNVHPALLPAFPGTQGLQEAWDYGVKVTGVTVHLVDEGTDTGPIVLQEAIVVESKETLETLEKKVHSVEHRLLPKAIQLFAEGRIAIEGRKVSIN